MNGVTRCTATVMSSTLALLWLWLPTHTQVVTGNSTFRENNASRQGRRATKKNGATSPAAGRSALVEGDRRVCARCGGGER